MRMYNSRAMKDRKLISPHKLMACLFALAVLSSFVFIGFRIATKSSYEAHEARQCLLLAVSAANMMAEETSSAPDMWDRIGRGEITLIIDHKTVPGNWVIKVTAAHRGGFVHIESSASSGWNTRSPQKLTVAAEISTGKDAGRIVYANAPIAKEALDAIRSARESGRTVVFRFPNELDICPVTIRAAIARYSGPDGDFIILKPAD